MKAILITSRRDGLAVGIDHSVKVQRDSSAEITDGQFQRFTSHPLPDAKSRSRDTQNENNRPEVAHSLPAINAKTPKNTGFFGVFNSGGGI